MTKRMLVPGVHDLIPPDGRITVELLHPETGRVRQKVQAENALMDWYRKNAIPNGGRGGPGGSLFSTLQYDSFYPMQDLIYWSFASDLHQPNSWPSPWEPSLSALWIWATSANVAPDQTKHHIPTVDPNGEVTSGARLDIAFTPDGLQLSRGTVVLASCIRSWARTRMVVEYGTAYGNGTYRSIGLGSVVPKRTGSGMRSCPPSMGASSPWNSVNGGSTAPAPQFNVNVFPHRGCVDYAEGGLWGFSSGFTGLGRYLPNTALNGSMVELVTLANLPGSGGQLAVAVNGSDFWISRNKALYRCVKPTSNVAVTITNTYDLTATVGADTILDIAVDRVANLVFLLTQTKVHVINGATGAPVSDFLHGMTSDVSAAIEWSKAENQLHVSFGGSPGSPDLGYGTWAGSASNYPANPIVRGFTTAGAAAKSFLIPQYGVASGNNSMYSAPYVALNEAGIGWTHRLLSSVYAVPEGPTMATHALLGADVVKTGADALRITYDFDFA